MAIKHCKDNMKFMDSDASYDDELDIDDVHQNGDHEDHACAGDDCDFD